MPLPRRLLPGLLLAAPTLAQAQGTRPQPVPIQTHSAAAAAPIRCFGAGGPVPAMRLVADGFRSSTGVTVEVIAGPASQWADRVAAEADLVFAAAEYIMDDYIERFRDALAPATRRSLYMRPAALLVRPGNPRGYAGLRDLLSRPPEQARILATGGAGQVGMYEDIATRTGDIALLRAMRQRIVLVAADAAVALQEWRGRPDAYDAWLAWNNWQLAAPDYAALVPLEEPFRIWRAASAVLTSRGAARPEVRRFEAFLAGPEGRGAFNRLGWSG